MYIHDGPKCVVPMEFFAHVIDLIDDTTSNQDEHHAHHHAESTTTFLKCCLLCLEDTHQRPDPCTFFSSQHEIEMLEHLDTAHPHVNMLDIYDVRFFRIRKTCETLSERTKYHKPLRLVNIVAVHAYFRLLEDNKQQQQQQRTFEYIVPMIECRFCVEAGNVEVERYEPPRHGFFLNDIWTHVQEAHAFRAREYLDLCSEMDDFQIKSSTHNHHRSTKTCNTTTKRPTYLSWDEYFIGIAFLSAQRSKDPRSQVGACIVDGDQKIVGIGYNGFPRGCSDDHLPWAREGPKELDTKYPVRMENRVTTYFYPFESQRTHDSNSLSVMRK